MYINSFSDPPVVRLLNDGRIIELVERFGFCDSRGREWWGEPGDRANGTSYPPMLWSLSGGPWSTKSRWGAILHDIECTKRTSPWEEVHRMFGEAIRICWGDNQDRAIFEFNAVWQFGPRWNPDGSDIITSTWDDELDLEMIGG